MWAMMDMDRRKKIRRKEGNVWGNMCVYMCVVVPALTAESSSSPSPPLINKETYADVLHICPSPETAPKPGQQDQPPAP